MRSPSRLYQLLLSLIELARSNLAYTDRSIGEQRLRLKRLGVTAADRLAPRPLRDRAAALAASSHAIIDAHEHTTVSNNQTRDH